MANLFNVFKQIPVAGIVGCGMTFVILTGGIDLSVGSIPVSYTHLDVYKRQVLTMLEETPGEGESSMIREE